MGLRQVINNHRCPLLKEEKALLYELSANYEVTDKACWYYRNKVNNNENDLYEIIKNKLIRDIILGNKIADYDDLVSIRYGNLEIIYDTKIQEISQLKNWIGNFIYEIDENKKKWLDKKLGLVEDKIKRNIKENEDVKNSKSNRNNIIKTKQLA